MEDRVVATGARATEELEIDEDSLDGSKRLLFSSEVIEQMAIASASPLPVASDTSSYNSSRGQFGQGLL